jgi:hypothetical protein
MSSEEEIRIEALYSHLLMLKNKAYNQVQYNTDSKYAQLHEGNLHAYTKTIRLFEKYYPWLKGELLNDGLER